MLNMESSASERRRHFHSQAIPGFWLNVNWLFADEPPDILDTVMTILAGNHQGVVE